MTPQTSQPRLFNGSEYNDLELRVDLFSCLTKHSMYHLLNKVLNLLDYLDIYTCSAVSKTWNSYIQNYLDKSIRIKKAWQKKNAKIKSIDCDKSCSLGTFSQLSSDRDSLFFGVEISGNIELWDRRPHFEQRWIKKSAHRNGIYAVEMNTQHCFSLGSMDEILYIWDRKSGARLHTLIAHEFLIWKVIFPCQILLVLDKRFVCLYSIDRDGSTLIKRLRGPKSWLNPLECNGEVLITQNTETFALSVWELDWESSLAVDQHLLFDLSGHTREVHCVVLYRRDYILSGSSDTTLRLWSYSSGECLRVLSGVQGRVLCADMNKKHVVSGGWFGEIGYWSLEEEDSTKPIIFQTHCPMTPIGSIKLEKIGLLFGDGKGYIFELDFWSS